MLNMYIINYVYLYSYYFINKGPYVCLSSEECNKYSFTKSLSSLVSSTSS